MKAEEESPRHVNTTAPAPPSRQFDSRWLLEMLALAVLYFLTARVGLLLALPGGHVTPVWPPSGIALAAILLRGQRVWPGIWLGSFTANLLDFFGSPSSLASEIAASATIGIGASLAALAGGFLLVRFVGGRNPLERVRDVCAFMALGGVVSCLVSATVGMTTLCAAGFAPWSGFGQTWLTWWLGDTAGVFIVAPLGLVWSRAHWLKSAARCVELFACFGLLFVVTYYVFIGKTTILFTGKPLAFLLIPFLVWPAVRFGQRGAVTAVGLIALLAVWGTIHNTGPLNDGLLLLELFLSVVVLTALCMAAMVTEREQAEAAQQRAMVELESRVLERTAALTRSESQARQHLAEAERARAALLSILEDEHATEAALRESEGRFRTIFEQAPLGIAEGEIVSMRFINVNKRYADVIGYTMDELLALTFKDFTHPEDLQKDLVEFQRLAAGEIQTYELEKRYIRKDGEVIWVNLTVSGMAQTGERPLHCMAIIDDITERKQAEEILHRTEQLYRQAIAGAGAVPYDYDYATRRYTFMGAEIEGLTGYRAEDFCGPLWQNIIQENVVLGDAAGLSVAEATQKVLRGEIPQWCSDIRILTRDGETRWLSDVSVQKLDAERRVVGSMGILQDITERKLAERKLAESSVQLRALLMRLQQAQEEERIRVARDIHDELGQMLTGLKMDVRWLERKLADPSLPQSLNPLLDRAVAASELADQTIAVVQKIAADLRPGALDRLGLGAALKQKGRRFEERTGVMCRVTVPETEPPLSTAVATELFYIAREALTNVTRHAQATEVQIRLEVKGDKVVLEVCDNGRGITEAELTTTQSLGLLGMRERAAHCRGTIVWERCELRGTRLTVCIPRGEALAKTGESA